MHVRHRAQDLALKYPVLYAFNYPLTYYSAFGYKPFKGVKESLDKYTGNAIMMPNLTNPSSNVEIRATRFLNNFEKLAKGHEKVHIVAHSFAGFDIRAMIALYDLQPKIASLSTVCTPHNGLTLLDNLTKHTEAEAYLSDALRPLGLNPYNVEEFRAGTMYEMNEELEDSETYQIYSFGSRTSQANVDKFIRFTASAIMDQDPLDDNDGITHPNDCKFRDYLLTFEVSHYESGGLKAGFDMDLIFGSVTDNIKLTEAKGDENIAKKFGLSYQEM
ncbi:unnamed protein product [Moneuplotes crassus]|uniref:Uncharacterized protein n=1 Tax=Euplotes crassus TaxID=5936 RepID=A0AAD2D1X2_EUPCR|nr:unnamed protein product [Moneuplotes crassus]